MTSRHITAGVWSWLVKCPPLPPVCFGRNVGTYIQVIKAAQILKDVEVLKPYLLLVWSEWNGLLSKSSDSIKSSCLSPQPKLSHAMTCSFCMMRFSIREIFGGVRMGHHRADLIHRLDHVLAQLRRGPRYLKEHNPKFDADGLQQIKHQYRMLRETLLETNQNAVSRKPQLMNMPLCMLTPTPDVHRIPHTVHVCTPSSMSVVPCLECSILLLSASSISLLRYRPSGSFCPLTSFCSCTY